VSCDRLERLGAAAFLASDDVDRSPVDEGHDPRARLGPLRAERRRRAPHREEALLHRVLRQPLVAEDAQRDPVRDAPDTVVQLGERGVVAARHERDQRLVGQVPVPSQRPGIFAHPRGFVACIDVGEHSLDSPGEPSPVRSEPLPPGPRTSAR
jgi:hypothetical protein